MAATSCFLDWQNVYKGVREAFCTLNAPHWQGQVDPVGLAQHLADDSPFSRRLHQVRIYRASPTASLTREAMRRAAVSMLPGSDRRS
jgi:hypothetical protein